MSMTLSNRSIFPSFEYVSDNSPEHAPEAQCTSCMRLAEMAPIVREMHVLRTQGRMSIASLTDRQREIMHLIVAGHPNKIIAMDLGISQRTVENHRSQIMQRTGTKSLPELTRLVFCANWPVASDPLC